MVPLTLFDGSDTIKIVSMTRHARMQDVARLARVSAITVSRVLRSPEKVSEDTRLRVLEAVRKIGYVPNAVAGSLSSSRTNIIAAIVPTITNPVFADTIHAMAAVLRARGYHLLLGQSGASPAEERSLIETFLAHRPDGLFIHGGVHSQEVRAMLLKAGIPIVEAGNLRKQPLDMVVSYSNYAAAETMTEHLIERGRRRIGFVSSHRRDNDRAQARRRGFGAALKHHGLPDDERLVLETTLGLRQGAEALVELAAREPTLDAVFFSGDVLAAGAIFECQRRGWAVPGKLAIAGFDDQEIASQVSPALTTVAVPRADIGRRAADMLLARLGGETVDPKVVDIGFALRIRAST
jgi:LacI family gluconate utilization system Gnt-I transcriptional repressor